MSAVNIPEKIETSPTTIAAISSKKIDPKTNVKTTPPPIVNISRLVIKPTSKGDFLGFLMANARLMFPIMGNKY